LLAEDKEAQVDLGWSPDGKTIVFGRFATEPQNDFPVPLPAVPVVPAHRTEAIYLLDVASGHVTALPGSQGLYAPRWSPDGNHIAALTSDSKKLLLYSFSSRQWKIWIDTKNAIAFPTWARDSQTMFFETVLGGVPVYQKVSVGTKRAKVIISLGDLRRYVGFGVWSGIAPDGTPLFVRDVSTDEIYALDLELR
jgi:Tol biopolymer transport system component